MGNALAFLMLAAWPAVVVVMFQRMDRERALIWSLLAGYLLLPPVTAINLPMIPDLDKTLIPSLAAALCLLARGDRALALPASGVLRVLIALFILGPFFTALSNSEPLIDGATYRPAYGMYDAFSTSVAQALVILPFLLARNILADAGAVETWLRALVVAGLAYSLPMLIEIRMSPQINVWVYGFFAHDFIQMIRYGGYRPMVFLSHGLWVALFAFMAAGAAAGMARYRSFSTRSLIVLVYLVGMVIVCKSAGALMYTALVVPVALLASGRRQLGLAALLALIVVAYPALRSAGMIPVETISSFVMSLDADRGGSLAFRLANETELLRHAFVKPLVGWGSWGRHMLVDAATGEFSTTSDGRWIILLGTSGVLGIVAEFGLFVVPVFMAWRCPQAWRDPLLPVMVLVHAATLIDLIPNATGTPLTLLSAGLILGQVERLRATAGETQPILTAAQGRRAPRGFAPAPRPAIRTLL